MSKKRGLPSQSASTHGSYSQLNKRVQHTCSIRDVSIAVKAHRKESQSLLGDLEMLPKGFNV